MKIVELTSEKLILREDQPLLWRVVGVGGAFLAGLAVAAEILVDDGPISSGSWLVAALIWAVIFLGGGGLWLVGMGDVSCVFDKARNTMQLKRKGLIAFIQGAASAECSLREISDVILEEDWEKEEKDDSGRVTMPGHKTFRIAVVLQSGRLIPLTLYYGAEHREKAEVRRAITKFLFHTDYKRKIRRIRPGQ